MTRCWLILGLLAFSAHGASAGEVARPVLLKTAIVVSGPVVRLADIFDGLAEHGATAVLKAPAPGARVTLNGRWLASMARRHGVAWRPGSPIDSVVVERASIVVGLERIEDLVRQAVAERGILDDISLGFDDPDLSLHLPVDSDGSLRLVGFTHDPAGGRFRARVVSPATGRAVAAAMVTGRVHRLIEVPVPRRRLTRADVIGADDIDWLRLRADRLVRGAITDPAEIVGKSPRRSLQPGKPLRATDLRPPVLVPRKSLVTIRLETKRMVLTARGRALDEGALGAVVRVMNTQSNSIIDGVVVGSGLVEVRHGLATANN